MLDFLMHYGTPRHSGRYPYGSGGEPYQSEGTLSSQIDSLRRKGLSEKEAAQAVGMTIAQVRAQRSLELAEKKAADISFAQKLRDKGMGYSAIGERMGKNESSIRSMLNPTVKARAEITKSTSDMLRRAVTKDRYIDIGSGVESRLGISSNRLATSVKALENEGYKVINVQTDQLGTDKKTTIKTLTPPGTTYKDVVTNMDRIHLLDEYSDDGGRSYLGVKPPVNVSSKRIQVIYAEDGGANKDGLIELRRGVEDLTLPGTARYAQVRIGVDGTHYLKGMALHVDKLPPGVDIRFNTSKPKGTPFSDTLKPISDDPDNPFGSTIKQFNYKDNAGNDHQSPINIVGSDGSPNIEGRWAEWSNALSSQIISKQPDALAKQQLSLILKQKQAELDDISKLTNPVIKRRLLMALADDADAASIHLKAAALPRQMNHVLLPVVSMPDHQVYAPNYHNGERLVLIRHPHGGKFEIPELTVNNNQAEAKRVLGRAKDAIGISPNVAKRLSGADFDGDHVLVIPNSKGRNQIHTSAALEGLKDFDPQLRYPYVPGMKVMGEPGGGDKQHAMGEVSNLITDMTIKGANPQEIARAVRHSMVVIDSEKHKLNYKLSESVEGISQLKLKYQGRTNAGASTLISKANSDVRVPRRKEGQLIGPISSKTGKPTRLYIDPKTGEKLYSQTGESYINKKGKEIPYISTITKMEKESDAHALSSGTTMEDIYAEHANSLKHLANMARKEYISVKNIPYSPAAQREYRKEAISLTEKLKASSANKPLERRAQLVANHIVNAKRKAHPELSRDDIRKIKGQALTEARSRVGAKKPTIFITPKEWNAIQKGAISPSRLEAIIQNADLDAVRALATPRSNHILSNAAASRARSMASSGYTMAQIAQQLGVSVSTVRSAIA